MKLLKKFKDEVVIGNCIFGFKSIINKDYFEGYNTENGIIIIQIYENDKGFEVYRSCPHVNINDIIEWVQQK